MTTSPLIYPFTDLPPAGQRFKVADGVFWLRFPLPFALDHINLWLLEDNQGWVIVDTGLGVRRSREIWQQLLAEELDAPVQIHLHETRDEVLASVERSGVRPIDFL